MKGKRMFPRSVLTVLALLLLSACSPDQPIAQGGTRSWIDVPRDRSVISLKPHEVTAHASDASGLRQVILVVNDVAIGMDCGNLARPLVACQASWDPAVPGDYRLEVNATNLRGEVATSKPVFITVGVKPVTPTLTGPARGSTDVATSTNIPRSTDIPTSTNVPTSTDVPRGPAPATPTLAPVLPFSPPESLTPIRTATRTLTPSPTLTPRPVCPGAPVISSFTASPGKITQGGTSTLIWGLVSNATSVEIDHGIGGVGTPGSRTVAPNTTTTYTLTAHGCGGTATRQVTILVTAPPTATPTRTPTLKVPAAPSNLHQVSRSCSSSDQIRIAWKDNSNNEAGFQIFRRIRSSSTWTAWSLRATVGANSTQYTDGSGLSKFDDVEYGVQAYNAAGTSARPTLFVSECID